MRFAVKKDLCIEYVKCTGYNIDEGVLTFDHSSKFTKALEHAGMMAGDIAVNTKPAIVIHSSETNTIYVKVDNWYCCRRNDLIMIQQCTDIVNDIPVFDNEPNTMQVAYKDSHEIKLNSYIILNKSNYMVMNPVQMRNKYHIVSQIKFI